MEETQIMNFEFSQISDAHFLQAMESTNFKECLTTHMREINLNGCREISDKTVFQVLAQHCGPSLLRVELYWNCRINDFCVKKLAQKCQSLEYVNLSGCKYLSDVAIKSVVDNCKRVHHLNLTRLPKLTHKGLEAVAKGGLTGLKYLNLYANAMIEEAGFDALAEATSYNKLQFLDLCGCKNLTDKAVVGMANCFPELTYLNLTWCVSLTDTAITDGVAKYLEKLELLSVYGLEKMTDASITALAAGKLKYSLKTLDINGCKLMTICTDHESVV